MDFYNNLNSLIDYIEDNLDKEIDYDYLALKLGVTKYIMQRIFPLVSGVSLSLYIKRRRLTVAAQELVQNNIKIIDLALKYGYESATSFSRAFTNFHGIKPSLVKNNVSNLKYYPRLNFVIPKLDEEIHYEIVTLEEMKLYGIGVKTNNREIRKDAPSLFKSVLKKYSELPHPNYGMVVYEDRFMSENYEYYVLWKDKYYDFEEKKIKKSRYIKFRIDNENAKDIQKASQMFYCSFLPTCKYKIKEEPELEYYHDGVCDFLIPIY